MASDMLLTLQSEGFKSDGRDAKLEEETKAAGCEPLLVHSPQLSSGPAVVPPEAEVTDSRTCL